MNLVVNKDKTIVDKITTLGIVIDKVNGREVTAFCPFHDDRHPSFFFNLDTEKFHCFSPGCVKGRGLHQLIYQVTGVSQAGVAKEVIVKKFVFNREQDKKILPTIPNLPFAIDNDGEQYLNSRGLNREAILKYGIKYWPEEVAVVLSIEDVGYVLRYINSSATKKYKYVAGTRITDTLFGLSYLSKTLTSIILVEGSFDCLHLHELGFENTLALLHSDMSMKQIKILGGITDNVYIMMDGDEAGKIASSKIKEYLKPRFFVKICNLPNGKDPDELTKEEIINILNEAK